MSHQPKRGDAVEAWIKRCRDLHNLQTPTQSEGWLTLDSLLDGYRLMADEGQILKTDDEIGEPDLELADHELTSRFNISTATPEEMLAEARREMVDASCTQGSAQIKHLCQADSLATLAQAMMTEQQHICHHGTRGWCPSCHILLKNGALG